MTSVLEADVFDCALEPAALVYADPPYDSGKRFGIGGVADFPALVSRMTDLLEPDGVAVTHLSTSLLQDVLAAVPTKPRVYAWTKRGSMLTIRPWLRVQYGWEPIVAWGGPAFSWGTSERIAVAEWDFFEVKAVPVGRSKLHPSEKPRKLIDDLLRPLARPGRRGLDLFAGSGVAAEVMRSYGMDVVAVERDARFADVCRGRLAQESLV